MLDSEYIAKLPKQKVEAALKICEDFFSGTLKDDPHDIAYTLNVVLGDDAPKNQLEEPSNSKSLFLRLLVPSDSRSTSARRYIRDVHRHLKAVQVRDTIAGNAIISVDQNLIEIESSQVQRIEILLSEIREIVRSSDSIDEDHKLRLLKIVSNFQTEIDKPISSYRVFLNGMIETSEALGTSGKKVKPVFDRVREVFGIADKAKKTIEQLSAPEEIKQLPSPEHLDSEE
ncbi:MAG: hypothetical protein ABJO57_12960 [Lentilitoribacter sp.]